MSARAVARLFLLRLMVWVWRYLHGHAKQYRVDLERTVVWERTRAQRDVEETEVRMRRAELALVEHRADERLARETA